MEHLQAGVTGDSLQGENVPAVAQEHDAHGMAEGVRAEPNALNAGALAVFADDSLQEVLSNGFPCLGQEQVVMSGVDRLGPVHFQILPNCLLYLGPEGDMPLPGPFTPDFQ